MEAAAVACRGGGVLARPLPGHRARRRHGVGCARRRFLVVASLEEAPPAPPRNAVAVAQEVICCSPPHSRSETPVPCLADSAPAQFPSVQSHNPVNTVQVKFVLQRQCAFGQRFLVVGDDPALGLWDPTKAAALEWSEGHVWTATMDLPANRAVEFKFLLQDPSGQVSWQHGHNRTLQIAETSKTLVVYEDWEDAKCQEVLEVTYPSIGAEDVHFAGSCNGAMLADDNRIDLNQQTGKGLTDVAGTDGGSSPQREKKRTDGANGPQVTDSPALLWFIMIVRRFHLAATLQDGHRLVHKINHTAAYGFLTQFTLEKDHKVPDVLRRRANMAVHTLKDEGAPVENRPAGMFENDMAWVRKALQRLLRSLGLQIGTTET
ncbi:hypothetical protein ACQ4PT_029920 [Festuca glaucescens]